MRIAAIALLSLAAGCGRSNDGVPAPTARPQRVMSLNQCSDQLVLALLPPERITSVTALSRDPQASLMAAAAARVPANRGSAEEVVRQRPDLVVTGSYTTPATRALLRRIGYPMIEIGSAESFANVRKVTRQVALAVGAVPRGEALIVRMDRQLAWLARHPARPVRVAAWDGAGFNASRGSLYDAILRAAGTINVADEPQASRYGAADAEVLLATAPALLVRASPQSGAPGLRDNVARHPLVRRYWSGHRTIYVRPAYYICGTTFAADASLILRNNLPR